MLKLLAYIRCRFYYELGNITIYLSACESFADLAYSIYNECMHRSVEINDEYDLDVWKKP